MKVTSNLKRAISVLAIVAAAGMLFSCSKKNDKNTTMTSETQKPLTVAMELAYPPFETKDSAGNPSGISVDFAKAFGESIGREVKIVNTQ